MSGRSFWPRAIFSGVCGLSGGMTAIHIIGDLGNLTCKAIDRSLESTQFAGSLPFQILYPKVLFLLFNRDP